MRKQLNAANALEPILEEVVSQWMFDILDQLEDQVNTISPEDYDDCHEYMEVVDKVTDFSNQLLFHKREQTIAMNLEMLFDDIQEAMNEFAMLDELEELEDRIFRKISSLIEKEEVEVQQITDNYLQRLYSGHEIIL